VLFITDLSPTLLSNSYSVHVPHKPRQYFFTLFNSPKYRKSSKNYEEPFYATTVATVTDLLIKQTQFFPLGL
jgi:hypothetical protein